MQVLKQLQIPYSFAKRHGVLLRYEGDQALLCADESTPLLAFARGTSFFSVAAQHQLCSDEEFHQLLSSSYAGDSGESQQVAAGLEDHPDLLSLADQVPEAEDLMDQEDDAPIVRLINALLFKPFVLAHPIFILKPLKRNYRCVYVSMGNYVKLCNHAVN